MRKWRNKTNMDIEQYILSGSESFLNPRGKLKIPLQEKYVLSATEPCPQPISMEVVTQDPKGEQIELGNTSRQRPLIVTDKMSVVETVNVRR